jgi:hypothetical protein
MTNAPIKMNKARFPTLTATGLFLTIAAQAAQSAPFVVCDAYPPANASKPTVATIFIDGLPGVDNPVADLAKPCHFDLANVQPGAHTATVTFGLVDPVIGRLDSIKSPALNFTLQGPPAPPSGLSISPN